MSIRGHPTVKTEQKKKTSRYGPHQLAAARVLRRALALGLGMLKGQLSRTQLALYVAELARTRLLCASAAAIRQIE